MIDHVFAFTLPAAFALLPDEMHTDRAVALLLAIGLQESEFQRREQLRKGPARGFWQFEEAGVLGVLSHGRTRSVITDVLAALVYPPTLDRVATVHRALEHNDTLAAAFARCLLWTSTAPMPGLDDVRAAWDLYLDCWRPGRPRPDAWRLNYATAWSRVRGASA
jgi:hypothetical protein